ncbi:hypothetical protein DPMN_036611 [Dreissena polymorpha]|uniref:Uncharacterized protein n=1 Tax=Dreissena polymorpha TaxID=45954 RepID=A0A9D4RNZ9_DREPO|nr:hypothetical protein DPMN_036611 [Dreissena polymorpha]
MNFGHLHEDWASNVTSTVFTSFELGRGIIWTNVLTKFHEDRTINVASRVFTRQMLTTDAQRTRDDGQKAITIAHHEHRKLHPSDEDAERPQIRSSIPGIGKEDFLSNAEN